MDVIAASSREPSPQSSSVNPGMPRESAVPEAVASDSDNHKMTLPFGSSPRSNVHRKRTAIFIQDECLKHRYIRSRDTSNIVERPERLHAVKLGLAAAISRIESVESVMITPKPEIPSTAAEGDLAASLARMAIAPASSSPSCSVRTASVTIRRTSASVSLLKDPAVKYVHGDIGRDVYLENLVTWARDSQKNIKQKGKEIPDGIPPMDLYLCPGSIDAIQGAIGAVCEAVDASMMATRRFDPPSTCQDDPCERAFVAVRPPGHHCGEDTPCGFCFINNVAVGAAHAHLKHGIQRIVILDVDLHHGNGTQSIVWKINEETYIGSQESGLPKNNEPPAKAGPRVFYGSLHDILSFPCEDGKPELVQAASTSIHGPHGQYIENIHIQEYDSEAHFWDILYPRYLTLLHRARDFLNETGGPGDDVIVFISCGFDAGEHEHKFMSRHERKVPVGFYHRFTRETCRLADEYARGRVVSVLEGGYKDRALISGAMAHLCGLVDAPDWPGTSELNDWVDPAWWGQDNLIKIENLRACKLRRSASARASMEEWLTRTLFLFSVLDGGGSDASLSASSARGVITDVGTSIWTTPASMTLRERKKPVLDDTHLSPPDPAWTSKGGSRSVSTSAKPSTEHTYARNSVTSTTQPPFTGTSKPESSGEVDPRVEAPVGGSEGKKLPRVILHVRPPDTAS